MARIIYKDGYEGKNTLKSIEGIEIDLLNGQSALIYPKCANLPFLDYVQIEDWRAKPMTEIEALKMDDSKSATDELLALDSLSAKFVRHFKSDTYGLFNMPTLLAALEIVHQLTEINELAVSIKGAHILAEGVNVSSCSRYNRYSRWIVENKGFAKRGFYGSALAVPVILY